MLLAAGCASTPPARPKFGADDIPEPLQLAVEDTYRKPVPMDCATIAAQITALDAALGPDVDTIKAADVPGHPVATAMVGAIKGLVPYGGVIRFVSGEHQRERRIDEAIAAGVIRRGYLKGMGEAEDCAVPASPVRVAPSAPASP